jgi:hypothetical protein
MSKDGDYTRPDRRQTEGLRLKDSNERQEEVELSDEFAVLLHRVTARLPREELYDLT